MSIVFISFFWGILSLVWTPFSGESGKKDKRNIPLSLNGIWVATILIFLTATALGEFGLFTRRNLILSAFIVSVPRLLIVNRRFINGLLFAHLVSFLLPGLFFSLAAVAPDPGEWIAGGWDPGVYMNQGIALSRTGSLYPDDQWFHDDVPDDIQAYFLRVFNTRSERFPGVVIHENRISYQFSRLFPSAVGVFAEFGGLSFASRINYWLALLCLATAFAWGQMFSNRSAVLFPIIILLNPIFTYHTHFPVTEMMEMGFVLWVGMIFYKKTTERRDVFHVSLALFAGILNRFSLLPFSGLFFLIFGFFSFLLNLKASRKLLIYLCFIFATLLGLGLSYMISPASIKGWSVTPVLLAVYGGGTVLGGILLFWPISQGLRKHLCSGTRLVLPYALPVLLFSVVITFWVRGLHPDINPYLQRLLPFVGRGWAALFILSFFFSGLIQNAGKGSLLFTFFLMIVTVVLLYDPQITFWYPWALRRYLSFSVPFIALLIVNMSEALSSRIPSKRFRHAFPALLVAGAMLLSGKTFLEGLRLRAYRGLEPVLQKTSEHLPADAIIIADDPRWGTPLNLIYGRKILCGRGLWGRKDKESFQRVLRALAEQEDLYFLTSLETGMEIYPDLPSGFYVELVHSFEPFTVYTTIQHPRAAKFALQPLSRVFTLYKVVKH